MASAPAVSALLRAYRPALPSEAEKAAFAVHLTFLASGFELVAAGENADASGAPPPEDPIQGWNQVPGEYTFLYALPGAGTQGPGPSAPQHAYLKCLSVGDVMMVDACAKDKGVERTGGGREGSTGEGGAAGEGGTVGSAEAVAAGAATTVVHTELSLSDFVCSTTAPAAAAAAAAGGAEGPSVSGPYPVRDMYKNLDGLVDTVATHICLPLLSTPSGSSAQGAAASTGAQTQTQAQAGAAAAPASVSRPGTEPPPPPTDRTIFPDEEGIEYPPIPGQPGFGDDLGPGGAAGIMPGPGPRFPGSGMLVGPSDPRWGLTRPGFEEPDDLYGMGGPGPGGRPRGVPPGARFDPYGPPGVPGFEPGRFGEDGGRRGPRGGLHRDLEPFL